ncbi:NOTCH3 [Branchiostoma lanceolatum]|uniref:NOTCH3 protein n=1 Tax=Branchiostoma lanceolatum TaxID=7740 RepID=A0A8K0ENY9_BRALA|nr:NOTCH3 [Branchiostoma lanceolatum]
MTDSSVGEALLDFPCMNGGTPVNFLCQCPPWATGYKCETDMIDGCLSSPCLHGSCVDHLGHYTCGCHPGWTGVHCETGEPNATCIDHVSEFTCQCAPGWTGEDCQTDIDECSSSHCPVNSTCFDDVNGYTCQCASGWTGKSCETDIDDCASGPCLSGETCLDHVTGHSCACPPETTGDKCETALYPDKCYRFSADSLSHEDASIACATMGGHLADVKVPQDQQLLAGLISSGSDVSHWTSVKTSSVLFVYSDGSPVSDIDECASSPCRNGGTCVDQAGSFSCTCDRGYTGVHCEQDIDLCNPNPCPYDWVCVDHVTGIHCEIPTGMSTRSGYCTASFCGPGWYCNEDGPTGFSCIRG